ncbi:stalk domain-containing protein [Rummeliibacillus sp. JY-2-4R]
MKRGFSSLLIASTVLASSAITPIALNDVHAKTVQVQKVEKGSILVDGKAKAISFTKQNKFKLYSVEQLSKLLSASYKYNSKTKSYELSKKINKKQVQLSIKANVATVIINGKKSKMNVAPKLVSKKLFAEPTTIIKALGADFDGKFLSPNGLVNGDTFDPQWVNGSNILVSNEDAENNKSLLLNTTTKKVTYTVNASGLVVSPNGKQAIYSDENGFVYLVDLVSKSKPKVLNDEDDSVKSEFVWSHDGKIVYFLQGDKSDKVGSIKVADGTISTIFSDSFSYKADLSLSVDGKKLLYTVGKEGSTTFTDGENPEVDNIDTTGTEPQIFSVNLTDTTPTAIALTNTTDNKVFPRFIANGNIVFLSAEDDDENFPELKMIDKNQNVTSLISTKEIVYADVSPKGEVLILVSEGNGKSVIYKVNTSTKKITKVASSKLKLTSFSILNDKSIVATTPGANGDQVAVLKNGLFELLTK